MFKLQYFELQYPIYRCSLLHLQVNINSLYSHNLFLHSALVLSRSTPASVRGMNDACRFFLFESGIALFVALLVNIAIISVSGTVCNAGNLSPEDATKCGDLTLDSSSFLLKVCDH